MHAREREKRQCKSAVSQRTIIWHAANILRFSRLLIAHPEWTGHFKKLVQDGHPDNPITELGAALRDGYVVDLILKFVYTLREGTEIS